MEEARSAHKILTGKPIEKKPNRQEAHECGIESPGSISHRVTKYGRTSPGGEVAPPL